MSLFLIFDFWYFPESPGKLQPFLFAVQRFDCAELDNNHKKNVSCRDAGAQWFGDLSRFSIFFPASSRLCWNNWYVFE